ncbi:hypothetical protein D5F01_LYC24143 [Larimichthys crocea]|uniref:Uncharacterized protein n=1 Tax=Larimichthys crocea TaxID=215358 RepID=A0A6G0HFK3_LARCR|nr:hypothetical protein D5F01_LYC24143 [Larimichthys crocea]
MACIATTKAHGAKRRHPATSSRKTPAEPSATCYLTRGSSDKEWYAWNTSSEALVLRKGDSLRTLLVNSNFEDTNDVSVRVLRDFTICGMGSSTCRLQREITSPEPMDDLARSAATQIDLKEMCTSKGIECATFLAQYTHKPVDEELLLGSRVHALFVQTVGEMLRRKYDIMHHYPLFNRALGLYYSDKGSSSDPPGVVEMIAQGGLLDRGVEEHQTLHGIPLVGADHTLFSRWNHPGGREEREESEALEEKEPSGNPDDETPDDRYDVLGDAAETVINSATESDEDGASASKPRCPIPHPHPSGAESDDETFTANMLKTFNNHPGTLTDRPGAFPYMFKMHTSGDLKFDDLVNYCITRSAHAESIGVLPARKDWGSVNPVLLMEDPVDPATGKTVRRYTVTSRGQLSTIVANRGAVDLGCSKCYNEVFLPDRPVSRLNLDVDLKCCRKCNEKFATRSERSVKHKVSSALTTSLILVIVESLLRCAKVKASEFESDFSLRELAKVVGKIAVYFRVSTAKSKLSLRTLWYLPVELCCFEGIEAYKPLLDMMEKVSLNYALLSYPDDGDSCGLCEVGDAVERSGHGKVIRGPRCLRIDPSRAANRRPGIDKAPYSFRKCVRLPNCYKEDSGFEYIDTFNTQGIEDPGFEDPLSLSVGLSSNPILVDVTSLGSRFRSVIKARGYAQPLTISGLQQAPDQGHVKSEARRLASLWGVPVTIRKTGSGLFCVQANEKSTTYPCPIHNRVHSTSKLGALVFASHTKPKCFVA